MVIMLTVINRKRFLELDKLLWDVHSLMVMPEFAFRVYEDRWGFVQPRQLSLREQALVRIFTRRIGHGIFAPQ
jgi:hypothetical protein